MNRNDFELLNKNIVYFDNGATTLKPKCVKDAICNYYTEYTANAHRGDYSLSATVDSLYEGTREKIRDFINAKETSEIVFTSGTTNSMNMIVSGFFRNYLKRDDEVLVKLNILNLMISMKLLWKMLKRLLIIRLKLYLLQW